MRTLFTILIVLAASFQSYCPTFDYDWLVRGIQRQREIATIEAKTLKVRKIAAVIRHIESRGNYHKTGGTGEYGAYQFMPKTWRKLCQKYAGAYLAPTKENQDFIAHERLGDLVEHGYTVSQIASIWNSGRPNCTKSGVTKTGVPFDVRAYRIMFVKKYKSIEL